MLRSSQHSNFSLPIKICDVDNEGLDLSLSDIIISLKKVD